MAINTSTTIYGVSPNISTKKRVAASVDKIYGLAYPFTKNLNAGWFSKNQEFR